jgi:hypothetical protein
MGVPARPPHAFPADAQPIDRSGRLSEVGHRLDAACDYKRFRRVAHAYDEKPPPLKHRQPALDHLLQLSDSPDPTDSSDAPAS